MDDVARLRRRLRLALMVPIVAGSLAACDKKQTSSSSGPVPHDLPSCPSGKWCGTSEQANAALKPDAGAPTLEMGCPTNLYPEPRDAGPALAADMPVYSQMSLNREETKSKGEGHCCYDWIEPCPGGRPLLVGDHAVTAQPPRRIASAGVQAALAELWLDDALMEHASVASFARSALELMALGSPTELIAACHQAAIDEVAHAAACFALAERHGWQRVDPGPMDVPAARRADVARMAVDVFVEGCVGETVAALCAERAHASCRDEQTQRALAMIADDEAAHAALAYRSLRWLLDAGGAPALRAVMAEAERLRAHSFAVAPADGELDHEGRRQLARWGRLDAAARRRARIDAWTGIIDPLLASISQAAA